MPYPSYVVATLRFVYEDLIWLANRPHLNPRQARAWYSHVMAKHMASTVRMFSGKVSKAALENVQGKLVLEHYERISHSLSRLLEGHSEKGIHDPDSFIELIERCERVNITTDQENHNARRAGGNYQVAGIILIDWNEVSKALQAALWRAKLRNQVANAADYAP